MENKNTKIDSLTNISNDDLDFNIEEVEQVVAPQLDNDFEQDFNGVSCSRKSWCC
ncbi:MAG: hypothetical protein FD167_5632 [bacterium]|nr:MAG: hypothetical protein FD167_5632 [bacterium]